jgi:N-acetylglucosamine-6-phosphate deacetylase
LLVPAAAIASPIELMFDCVAAAGFDEGEHCIAGQSITVKDGRAVVAATGVLVTHCSSFNH